MGFIVDNDDDTSNCSISARSNKDERGDRAVRNEVMQPKSGIQIHE